MNRSLPLLLTLLALTAPGRAAAPPLPNLVVGYTQLRTDLPGGRHANVRTFRATLVNVDTGRRRTLAADLASAPETWTDFAGWSPDGRVAILGRGWQSAANAATEERTKAFHFTKEGRSYDNYLLDLSTNKAFDVTGVERVSFYSSNTFFWPGDPSKLGFVALVDGTSHPFRMDRDGRNKVDLTKETKQYVYGVSVSPDGKRIAYHKDYQVYLADADGSNAVHVKTGKPFNFVPRWSPDGKHVLFVSGQHYDCHPTIVGVDGKGLRKLADRGGHRGVVEFLDVPDFHGGSSDVPAWANDGRSVFYTAKVGKSVELFRVALDGKATQLTRSKAGTLHYHPQPSPDGAWLLFGSRRDGVRQLFVMRLADGCERRITDLKPGHGAMWGHWRPAARWGK